MFEVFGEMDSAEELNVLAENLYNEGDIKSLRVMAEENGIEKEMVELYVAGESPAICDETEAALGKLKIEENELKPTEIMKDWVEYIKGQCIESERIAIGVRKKGKSLEGCIAALLKWSFENQKNISKSILEEAGVKNARVTLGIPGMGRAKKIIMDYYTENRKEAS